MNEWKHIVVKHSFCKKSNALIAITEITTPVEVNNKEPGYYLL
jgi:hypothetical protein